MLLAFSQQVLAVEGRPKMRRACLTRIDSTLDLQWFRPTDNCNSFTHFNLYGRDNILSVFELLGTYNDFSLSSLSIKLRNLKDWEFFLVYHTACNGTDSVLGDTIQIDINAPVDSQLDSVSVDLSSQRVIIGWPQNPSPDTRGYLVYHITNVNTTIKDTFGTGYLDFNRNPENGSIEYGVAAYDTCRNTSLISDGHRTIYLQSQLDQCLKTISLTWSPYVGWDVSEYDIFLSINGGNYTKIGNVVSQINQFTYNFNNFGDQFCFYVRAHKDGSSISSSSNRSCISSNSIVANSSSYIAKASVQGKHVELTLVTELGTSLEQIKVYKAVNSGSWSLWQQIPSTGGVLELIDNDVQVQSSTYSYFFETVGPCDLIFDSSQVAQTILLKVVMIQPGDQSLNWNPYDRFIKYSDRQEVLLGNSPDFNKSSPWNILSPLANPETQYSDNSNFGPTQEQLCYCIRAIENNPTATYNRRDTSYSNIQCVTADPIIYFPNAISLNGFNTIFYPKGVFVDTTKSSFTILNRWGQVIFKTNDIYSGWDGKVNGAFVQSDVYVYKATITGINGKVLVFDGTLTVLK